MSKENNHIVLTIAPHFADDKTSIKLCADWEVSNIGYCESEGSKNFHAILNPCDGIYPYRNVAVPLDVLKELKNWIDEVLNDKENN